jgi:predicted GH43/DUF377 family glycosyl hydrolase
VIACGAGGATDNKIREIGNVLYEPTDTGKEYKFFYSGYNVGEGTDERIHYAYSSDGISWTKYASNPVIARRGEDPYCLKVGSTYYLYTEDTEEAVVGDKIRCYTSADCITWADQGQITGITNCQSPVVWKEGAVWYMLYEHYPTEPWDLRLATSSDGLAWTDEASNPVMSLADTDWAGTAMVPDDIIKIGGVYYMLYHASSSGLWVSGFASSSNLTAWTDSVYSPLPTFAPVAGKDKQTCMFVRDAAILYYETDDGGVKYGYPIAYKYN